MPQLIAPHVRVHASYVAALAEFRGEGRGGPDDDSTIGRALRTYGDTWHDPEVFAEYIARLNALAPDPAVPRTSLWYADGDTYLGRLVVRHTLGSRFLRQYGGHLGYDVRPSARRRGHATAMLREALPIVRGLGIDRALVTCESGNIASRRVIEACGGELEDERHGMLRFWVPTGDA
ncbi:MAG: hypothetical protein QOI83_3034 [Streptomycetaceae bacterium]|nr:hypothetical protein [Streptomycetaceae bacterium]